MIHVGLRRVYCFVKLRLVQHTLLIFLKNLMKWLFLGFNFEAYFHCLFGIIYVIFGHDSFNYKPPLEIICICQTLFYKSAKSVQIFSR